MWAKRLRLGRGFQSRRLWGAVAGIGSLGYLSFQSKGVHALGDEKSSLPPMEYRRLGNTGVRVSSISFGSWLTMKTPEDELEAERIFQAAKECGINFFDNAEGYAAGEAEKFVGRIIKKLGWKRKDYVISTKIFFGGSGINDMGLSRKHIIEGLNASLDRLQLDYVDVVFAHRPDPTTPIEETVRAMNYLIDRGLTFYWGTSEWSAEQITEAHAVADRLGLIGPQVEQPQYNLLKRERFEYEYATLFAERKMGSTIWSPLASGVLTGKYAHGNIPKDSRLAKEDFLKDQYLQGTRVGKSWEEVIDNVTKLQELAKRLGCSVGQLSIAWCLKNPNVSTVIMGATKVDQVRENVGALSVVPKLTPAVMEEIEAIMKNAPPKQRTYRP